MLSFVLIIAGLMIFAAAVSALVFWHIGYDRGAAQTEATMREMMVRREQELLAQHRGMQAAGMWEEKTKEQLANSQSAEEAGQVWGKIHEGWNNGK